jgi:hypothetical protein
MTPKEKQRELIVEIMKADEQSGIYDEPAMKQTAVDWLVMKWATQGTLYSADITHALEMEKEQMKDAFDNGYHIGYFDRNYNLEQYYKETYE